MASLRPRGVTSKDTQLSTSSQRHVIIFLGRPWNALAARLLAPVLTSEPNRQKIKEKPADIRGSRESAAVLIEAPRTIKAVEQCSSHKGATAQWARLLLHCLMPGFKKILVRMRVLLVVSTLNDSRSPTTHMLSHCIASQGAIRVNVAGMAKPERAKPSAIMDKTKSLARLCQVPPTRCNYT